MEDRFVEWLTTTASADALRWVIVAGVGYAIWVLRGIKHNLESIIEKMVMLETWRKAHEKQDDERHDMMLENIREMRREAHRLGR